LNQSILIEISNATIVGGNCKWIVFSRVVGMRLGQLVSVCVCGDPVSLSLSLVEQLSFLRVHRRERTIQHLPTNRACYQWICQPHPL
jgi:hypothetical protein